MPLCSLAVAVAKVCPTPYTLCTPCLLNVNCCCTKQERCSLLQIEASSALRERSDLQEQVEELLQQLITVADSSDSGKGAGAKGTAADVDVEDLRRQLAGMKVRLLTASGACKAMHASCSLIVAPVRLCRHLRRSTNRMLLAQHCSYCTKKQ
jgi:tartrate dehydratase alpha subunit/fumarate hydratase class I-like protein